MRILVISGGDSDERDVSLRSGASIETAVRELGHEVLRYDPVIGLDALTELKDKFDIAFPMLHGKGGEDGVIQARLEQIKVPFLGANAEVSALCFDKQMFKKNIADMGIHTPSYATVTKDNIQDSPLLITPFVLKPNDGGSSIDTYIVREPGATQLNYEDIFSRHEHMLLEQLIEGTEITVSVLDGKSLPIIEIIPPKGKEFDYENKYNDLTKELCPPINVHKKIQKNAQAIVEIIHSRFGVRHLSRTDIIIDPNGALYVLELNTMPGMTTQSLYPKSAAADGMTMPQLIQKFIDMVAD